jgi:hypothetical protein
MPAFGALGLRNGVAGPISQEHTFVVLPSNAAKYDAQNVEQLLEQNSKANKAAGEALTVK